MTALRGMPTIQYSAKKRTPICTCHLTQSRLRWGLPPYQVAFWSIQPFGHSRHRPKFRGLLCPLYGSWVPI